MKACLSIILIVITNSQGLFSQEVVAGRLISKNTQLPLENVTVKFLKGTALVFSTKTDTSGIFIISKINLSRSASIEFISPNYNATILNVPEYSFSKEIKMDFLGTFEIEKVDIFLKEVRVSATNRYSDTINISPGNAILANQSVSDILVLNAGLNLDRFGRLTYQNRIVTDFKVNGKDFFANSSTKIYDLIPGIALENIQLIKTNIDSLTNVTLSEPIIKVNIKLKEKYRKGNFGQSYNGVGTSKKYLGFINSYFYNDKHQVSAYINLNNINAGDNSLQEPDINFSSSGTIPRKSLLELSHKYFLSKMVNLEYKLSGYSRENSTENNLTSQSLISDEFSNTSNKSSISELELTNGSLKLDYKIDSLTNIQFQSSLKFNNSDIKTISESKQLLRGVNNFSQNVKDISSTDRTLINSIIFDRKSQTKMGRLSSIKFQREGNTINFLDNNTIRTVNTNVGPGLKLNFDRGLILAKSLLDISHSEPINDVSYFKVFGKASTTDLQYEEQRDSAQRSRIESNTFNILNSQFGTSYQTAFNNIVFNGLVYWDFYRRRAEEMGLRKSFPNGLGYDISGWIKINDLKKVSFGLTKTNRFPTVYQLTDIKNLFNVTYNLLSNPLLSPETVVGSRISYDFGRKVSSGNTISIDYELYKSKIGLSSNTINSIQNMMFDNIGEASKLQLTFAKSGLISSNSSAYIQSAPVTQNGDKQIIKSWGYNQSLYYALTLNKNIKASHNVNATFVKFSGKNYSQNAYNFIYSGKWEVFASKFKISLNPLLTANYLKDVSSTFCLNAEIKRSLLKNNMIWIKVFDALNTFNMKDNYPIPGYTLYNTYTYTKRFFLIGASIKFTNIN